MVLRGGTLTTPLGEVGHGNVGQDNPASIESKTRGHEPIQTRILDCKLKRCAACLAYA